MQKIQSYVTLLLVLVLSGCGQTGPLYLPKPPKPAAVTVNPTSTMQANQPLATVKKS